MVHMVKLCVGISSVEELEEHRKSRCVKVADMPGVFHVHSTRMRPKRRGEIIGIGSLYWVIKGAVRCRQKIVALGEDVDAEGRTYCNIIMDPQLIRTVPYPKRPFQGWRYLLEKDAPGDLNVDENAHNDAQLAQDLAALGLI